MDTIPHTPGIYAIRNLVNGHLYVGSAVNIYRRKYVHISLLRKGTHHSPPLQRAFNKYGEDMFAFDVLEHIEDKSLLIEREQFFIDSINPEYNISRMAGSTLGYRHTEEAKTTMSLKSRTRPRQPHSEVTKQKSSVSNRGQKRSPEVRANIKKSGTRRAKPWTDEQRQAARERRQGYKHSDKTREKMSSSQRGRKLTPEHCKNMHKAMLGKKLTDATKAKLSQNMTNGQGARMLEARRLKRLAKEEAERIKNLQRFADMPPMEPIDPLQHRPMSLWEWNEDTPL